MPAMETCITRTPQFSDVRSLKRNSELDFWKFIAAMTIVCFHSKWLFGRFLVVPSGYLAVEFFFYVSGSFFAQSIFKDTRPFSVRRIFREDLSFIGRKIRVFLKCYVLGFFLSLFFQTLYQHGIPFRGKNILGVLFDFCGFRSLGLPFYDVFPVGWYLSSMLIALFLLYPVFRWRRQLFLR